MSWILTYLQQSSEIGRHTVHLVCNRLTISKWLVYIGWKSTRAYSTTDSWEISRGLRCNFTVQSPRRVNVGKHIIFRNTVRACGGAIEIVELRRVQGSFVFHFAQCRRSFESGHEWVRHWLNVDGTICLRRLLHTLDLLVCSPSPWRLYNGLYTSNFSRFHHIFTNASASSSTDWMVDTCYSTFQTSKKRIYVVRETNI